MEYVEGISKILFCNLAVVILQCCARCYAEQPPVLMRGSRPLNTARKIQMAILWWHRQKERIHSWIRSVDLHFMKSTKHKFCASLDFLPGWTWSGWPTCDQMEASFFQNCLSAALTKTGYWTPSLEESDDNAQQDPMWHIIWFVISPDDLEISTEWKFNWNLNFVTGQRPVGKAYEDEVWAAVEEQYLSNVHPYLTYGKLGCKPRQVFFFRNCQI